MVKRAVLLLPKGEFKNDDEKESYKGKTLEDSKFFYITQIMNARDDRELLSTLASATGVEYKSIVASGRILDLRLFTEVEVSDEVNEKAFKDSGL